MVIVVHGVAIDEAGKKMDEGLSSTGAVDPHGGGFETKRSRRRGTLEIERGEREREKVQLRKEKKGVVFDKRTIWRLRRGLDVRARNSYALSLTGRHG